MATSPPKTEITLRTIPTELRLQIFELALSTDDFIDVTVNSHDRIKEKPNPILGVGLLTTCHQFYHEARGFLYNDKTLLFSRYGLELYQFTKPLGIPRCEAMGCKDAKIMPVLDKVIFAMGHRTRYSHGETSLIGFDGTLTDLRLRGGIHIKNLLLRFDEYSFTPSYRPFRLLDALRAIKGVEVVGIAGQFSEREVDQYCDVLFGPKQYRKLAHPVCPHFRFGVRGVNHDSSNRALSRNLLASFPQSGCHEV